MSAPIVVGLNAWKKSGKDELCKIVMAKYLNVRRHGFADALYNEVAKAFGLTVAELKTLKAAGDKTLQVEFALSRCTDLKFREVVSTLEFETWRMAEKSRTCTRDVFESEPRSFRSTLQLWGTEYRRKHNSPTYWVDRVTASLSKASEDGVQLVLINDVRFDNEWNAIEAHAQGMVLRIIREKVNLEMQEAIANKDPNAVHPSELEVANRTAFGNISNPEGNAKGMLPQFERLIQAKFGTSTLSQKL